MTINAHHGRSLSSGHDLVAVSLTPMAISVLVPPLFKQGIHGIDPIPSQGIPAFCIKLERTFDLLAYIIFWFSFTYFCLTSEASDFSEGHISQFLQPLARSQAIFLSSHHGWDWVGF